MVDQVLCVPTLFRSPLRTKKDGATGVSIWWNLRYPSSRALLLRAIFFSGELRIGYFDFEMRGGLDEGGDCGVIKVAFAIGDEG